MIEPQTGFALIALTRTGRGGDAGWPARDNHEFEGIWPAKCTARGVSEFSQLVSGCLGGGARVRRFDSSGFLPGRERRAAGSFAPIIIWTVLG